MRPTISAGILMYRFQNGKLQVLLAHPGGPFYKNKDNGFWTIPKGEIAADEVALDAAIREFTEETGITPQGDFIFLGSVKQKSGKTVHAWAFAGDWDETEPVKSNTFELEWPPHSGIKQLFPEIDRALFFSVPEALEKINEAQREFIIRLEKLMKENSK
ncbi:MAG: NUDIX domain-containing protein [Proteobacteria bacterium]|nr:NUDIX domain-containing protein [Pseudomonadota bacterium]